MGRERSIMPSSESGSGEGGDIVGGKCALLREVYTDFSKTETQS